MYFFSGMRASPHREAVAALLRANEGNANIAMKLNISIRTVQRVAKQLREKGHVKESPKAGRPRTVNTRKMRDIIKKRIKRNDELSLNKMAAELKISRGSLQNIVKNELKLRSYRLRQGQYLTDAAKANRLQKCKNLLKFFQVRRFEDVLWTDEKVFTVEVAHNSQNHRQLLSPTLKNTLARKIRTRTHFPKSLMVWGGITATSKTPLIFIEKNVKINAQVYQEVIIKKAVIPWSKKNPNMIFQQDWAPAHAAKTTMALIERDLPSHLSKEEYPSNSPDLNPLDFSIWGFMEESLKNKKMTSLVQLRRQLTAAWAKLDDDYLRRTVSSVVPRLKACIKAEGSNFESFL